MKPLVGLVGYFNYLFLRQNMFMNKDGKLILESKRESKIKIQFLEMPDDVVELNYSYWTSMTRLGCIGEIKNCFADQKNMKASYPEYDTYFWRMFDRTNPGACVALQSLPFGLDQQFGAPTKSLIRYAVGPLFVGCKELNYFACEGTGKVADYVDESKLTVKDKIHFFYQTQIEKLFKISHLVSLNLASPKCKSNFRQMRKQILNIIVRSLSARLHSNGRM